MPACIIHRANKVLLFLLGRFSNTPWARLVKLKERMPDNGTDVSGETVGLQQGNCWKLRKMSPFCVHLNHSLNKRITNSLFCCLCAVSKSAKENAPETRSQLAVVAFSHSYRHSPALCMCRKTECQVSRKSLTICF